MKKSLTILVGSAICALATQGCMQGGDCSAEVDAVTDSLTQVYVTQMDELADSLTTMHEEEVQKLKSTIAALRSSSKSSGSSDKTEKKSQPDQIKIGDKKGGKTPEPIKIGKKKGGKKK